MKEPRVTEGYQFLNEDGVRYHHAGYVRLACSVCGKPFGLGLGANGDWRTCGGKACDHAEVKPMQQGKVWG